MSRPAPLPAATNPPPADHPAPARALIEHQLAMLTRLAEIGMGVAEDAGRRSAALAQGGGAGTGETDPGLSYARAARAVRLTIALQSRLSKDLAALDRGETLARTAEAFARRHRIHRLVERAVEDGCDDEDEAEQLSSDAWERLTETEDDDLIDRPLAEAVALVCRDLGLSPAVAARMVRPFGPWGEGGGDGADGALLPATGGAAGTEAEAAFAVDGCGTLGAAGSHPVPSAHPYWAMACAPRAGPGGGPGALAGVPP